MVASFKRKVVLVRRAGPGIGQASAVAFAHKGAKKEQAVAATVPMNQLDQPHEVADGLGTTKELGGPHLLDEALYGGQGGIGKLEFERPHEDAILSTAHHEQLCKLA
jgi:hypothetical protein